MNGLPDPNPDDRVSGTALDPCAQGVGAASSAGTEGVAPPLPSAPADLPLTGIKRQIRTLAQEICGLIGELAEIDRPRRTLIESCWLFDELGERAEQIEAEARLLRHMADVMWERAYREGARRRAYHEPEALKRFDEDARVSGAEQLARGVRF